MLPLPYQETGKQRPTKPPKLPPSPILESFEELTDALARQGWAGINYREGGTSLPQLGGIKNKPHTGTSIQVSCEANKVKKRSVSLVKEGTETYDTDSTMTDQTWTVWTGCKSRHTRLDDRDQSCW